MFHDSFYKNENIDFMDYFLSLVPKRKEFCVEPIKLQEYKVLNNINTSGTVLRTLKQYDLEEGLNCYILFLLFLLISYFFFFFIFKFYIKHF